MKSSNKSNNAGTRTKSRNKATMERTEASLARAASVLKSLSDWNKANTRIGL